MANIKARVDVSISPYLTIPTAANQPEITSGLTSSTFPAGYIGWGSYLATIDAADNNITVTDVSAVLVSNSATRVQISALGKKGTLILKNSGFEEAAKTTAANAGSDVLVYVTDAETTIITKLTVENKDVFVIPYTGLNISSYYFRNELATASKPVYVEGFFMHDTNT